MWPARAPAAGHIGIIELGVKAARLLVGHDQFPVFRRCYFVQLSIRYRSIVVVLLPADQPVPVRHFRWNYRERLHVPVRKDLRVFARHCISFIITDPLPCVPLVFSLSLSLLAALFTLKPGFFLVGGSSRPLKRLPFERSTCEKKERKKNCSISSNVADDEYRRVSLTK